MKKSVIVIVFLLFCGCIFKPEEPPQPDGVWIDKLNLRGILSGTQISFSFNSYRELFENSDTLFLDRDGNSYSAQRFISRLNHINDDPTAECYWATLGGDGFISMNTPTTLNLRAYGISSQRLSDTLRGEVKITVRYSEMFGWQITRWEEMDEKYSYFHPVLFGN